MRVLFVIAKVLVIVGGLNWGLIGLFDYNLVDAIFGAGSVGSQVVYIIVGIAALLTIIDLFVAKYSDRPVVVREPESVLDPMNPINPNYGA